MTFRGEATGTLEVMLQETGSVIGRFNVTPSKDWCTLTTYLKLPQDISPLFLHYQGSGKMDMLEIVLQ